MIDTVKLEIRCKPDSRSYQVRDFRFGGKKKEITNYDEQNQVLGAITEILLSWPQEMREFYVPEVKFVRYPNHEGGIINAFTLEASLPKLMWGNNYYEVRDCDFQDIVNKLVLLLDKLELPIKITASMIKFATVRRVDYCMNFNFNNGFSMRELSDILNKAEFRQSSSYGKVHYHRGGELYKDEIRERRYIIYDKVKELQASSKKARPAYGENHKTPLEIYNLVQEVHRKGTEVVRHELQITSTKQLKTELKREGYSVLPTFHNIYNGEIAGRLLYRHWSKMVSKLPKRQPLALDSTSLLEKMEVIATTQKNKNPIKAFGKLGFTIIVDICGLGKVRELYNAKFNNKNWWRTKSDLTFDKTTIPTQISEIDRITNEFNNMEQQSILTYIEDNKLDEECDYE